MSYRKEILDDMELLTRTNIGWITDEQGQPLMYSLFVARLMKDMGSEVQNLLHAVVGISGEAGELLDAVKKHWIYGRELDRKNVKEELYDIMFYFQAVMILMNLTWQDLLTGSKDKLFIRYVGGNYSDAAAIARADKEPTVYEKVMKEHKPGQAINLPAAAVAGTDDMAGLEITKVDPEQTVPQVSYPDSLLVPPLP